MALDLARDNDDPTFTTFANTMVIVAVMSILITSPIGAILIMRLGPKFLHKSEGNFLDNIPAAAPQENHETAT